ncbi:hypothetical protein NQ318_006577 [Aromia moschata]|uniref:Uncharacterized protein n=1 Tax=Aromia moschata TaxID=1265417 RepID=A0AAV8YPT2_9CUCU|nr:hypothetical protein NQ318_006577 [Aromia moschata]
MKKNLVPLNFNCQNENVLINKAKRNVLASIQDNRSNIIPITSTPITVPPRKSLATNVNEDIANYFDFENNISVRDKSRNSESRPFRIKNYGKKHPNTPQEREQEEEGAELEDLSFPKFEESRDATDNTNIQLFEDLEKDFTLNVPSKIYERKPRRKRLKCVEVENEEEHPKKRKKDMMTKAEEAALEEWAQKFNSMCREVEKYNLEID